MNLKAIYIYLLASITLVFAASEVFEWAFSSTLLIAAVAATVGMAAGVLVARRA